MTKCLRISFLLLSACAAAPAAIHARQNEDADRTSKAKKIETMRPEPRPATRIPPRRTAESSPPARVKAPVRIKKEEPPPPVAEVTISVSPADSAIVWGGVEYSAENGTFTRRALRPGMYKVVVRKAGYREETYHLNLDAGQRTPLSVSLEPMAGTLNVVPGVEDATISVVNAETNTEVRRYTGRVRDMELAPGRYQVIVSKSGYRTTVRDVAIDPAGSVYLEPPLELLPAERRHPAGRSFRPDSAMRMQSAPEGKFVVLSLAGRSGSTTSVVGSVDVTLGGGGGQTDSVSGMLTGFPCQVDFVRLENVAEYSFVEPPGTGNQWGRVVVRVRPKNSKRAMRFLINWKTLQNTPAGDAP